MGNRTKGRRNAKSSVFLKCFQKDYPFENKAGLVPFTGISRQEQLYIFKRDMWAPCGLKNHALLPTSKESKRLNFLGKMKSRLWMDATSIHSPRRFLQLLVLDWKSNWIPDRKLFFMCYEVCLFLCLFGFFFYYSGNTQRNITELWKTYIVHDMTCFAKDVETGLDLCKCLYQKLCQQTESR